MSRVYGYDFNPSCLSLVSKKAKELGKRPGVHTTLPSIFLRVGDTLADISQLLKHDDRAWGCVLSNVFAQDMVMVFTLPKQLTRKFLQVPFGRLRTFFLKLTTKTEETSFLLFPLLAAKKVTSRSDSKTDQTQVYPSDHS